MWCLESKKNTNTTIRALKLILHPSENDVEPNTTQIKCIVRDVIKELKKQGTFNMLDNSKQQSNDPRFMKTISD